VCLAIAPRTLEGTVKPMKQIATMSSQSPCDAGDIRQPVVHQLVERLDRLVRRLVDRRAVPDETWRADYQALLTMLAALPARDAQMYRRGWEVGHGEAIRAVLTALEDVEAAREAPPPCDSAPTACGPTTTA
jgi:hypothetical protein